MSTRFQLTVMGMFLPILMMVSLVSMAAQPAAADLSGIWQGKLAVDARTSLTVQFTFTRDAKGGYTAVLDSPDNDAIKNMAAGNVTWDGANLKLQVAPLSGSYAGTLKGGKLDGQWTQPGGALPLVLAPYQKPVITKAAANALIGSWTAAITLANQTNNIVFNFKNNDKGELEGTFSIPDQGLNNAPLSSIEFANNQLSVRMQQPRIEYSGVLSGNQIAGTLKVPSPAVPPEGIPATLKRGEYKAPVHVLNLTTEAFAALRGKWQGNIELTPPNGQKVTLPMVLRIESNGAGQYVGFIDSPAQRATNIAVTEATFANNALTVKIDAVKGEYKATLAGKTLTGTWTQAQAGLQTPLVLTRQ